MPWCLYSFSYTEAPEAVLLLLRLSHCLFLSVKKENSQMRLELLVDEPSKENTLFIKTFMRVFFFFSMEGAEIRQNLVPLL